MPEVKTTSFISLLARGTGNKKTLGWNLWGVELPRFVGKSFKTFCLLIFDMKCSSPCCLGPWEIYRKTKGGAEESGLKEIGDANLIAYQNFFASVLQKAQNKKIGGGFKYFLCSPLLGEMIDFD